MPTYLILFIGRLLAVGILDFAYSRLLLAGRPFILRGEFGAKSLPYPITGSPSASPTGVATARTSIKS